MRALCRKTAFLVAHFATCSKLLNVAQLAPELLRSMLRARSIPLQTSTFSVPEPPGMFLGCRRRVLRPEPPVVARNLQSRETAVSFFQTRVAFPLGTSLIFLAGELQNFWKAPKKLLTKCVLSISEYFIQLQKSKKNFFCRAPC